MNLFKIIIIMIIIITILCIIGTVLLLDLFLQAVHRYGLKNIFKTIWEGESDNIDQTRGKKK